MARQQIGCIDFGNAVITPGFNLDAKYVIHTVGPVWKDGSHGEEQILSSCYRKSLALAKEHECESIAFPLIATGNYGFPKPLALQIAVREISTFLLENEMQIYLVVFGKEAFALSENCSDPSAVTLTKTISVAKCLTNMERKVCMVLVLK